MLDEFVSNLIKIKMKRGVGGRGRGLSMK